MPRLIINADDLGLTSGVNRAVEEAGRKGVLTSATLMANSPAFDEAVALAKSLPSLRVGCHIVLIDGEPLSPGLRTLTNGALRFMTSLKSFALAALRKRLSQDEIQQEAEAQIRRLQSAGIIVTHVDTHKHTHMFPHVLRPVLRAARACGVFAARNPFEPFRACPPRMVARNPSFWSRAAAVFLLQKFKGGFQRILAEEGIRSTQGTVGVSATGSLNQKILTAIIRALPEGTWELVCHPGYLDAALRSAGTRLLESRQVELEALTSAETRQVLAARGVQLISYAELKS